MNKSRKTVALAVFLLYTVIVSGTFYIAGYKTAYDRFEHAVTNDRPQTFYAVISDIQDNTITVKGMAVNDINFRGDFRFTIVEETEIIWRYTDISIEDLEIGDNISVTFTGEVLESDPVTITQVDIIQLLDDEM